MSPPERLRRTVIGLGLSLTSSAGLPSVPERSRRMLVAWSASTLPVTPLLLLGMLLGPHGLALFSPRVLAVLDPAVPVALGALGILLGFSIPGRAFNRLTALAAGAETALTVGIVGLGMVGVTWAAAPSIASPFWFLPLFGSLCAAASLTLPGRRGVEPRRLDEALTESEVAMMIVAGGLVVSSVRAGSAAAGLWLFAQASGVTMLLAGAGWLLVRDAAGVIETRIFAFAAVLVVGGSADYLSFSALLGGLAAGLLWNGLGGPACERLQRETLYAQHPFVVLVLLVAGSRTELSAVTIGLGAAYAVIRSFARILSGAVLWPHLPGITQSLRLRLVDHGIFGVAFALTLNRALGAEAALTLSVVVIGTVLSDIMRGLATSRGADE